MRIELFKGVFAYIEPNPVTGEMVATVEAPGKEKFKLKYTQGEMIPSKLKQEVAKRLWPHA